MNDTATRSSSLELAASAYTPRYAGFSRRLLASLIDSLLFMTLASLYWWGAPSRTAALALLPLNAFFPLYSVCLHARWGQTLGKMAAGIRVFTLSGARITWRQAFLRDSVGLAFTTVSTASLALTVLTAPGSTWDHGWIQAALLITGAQPIWGRWAQHACTAWFWSELLVLLFNPKRRALHDFIAGTVVVDVSR